jgi:hypothetical protein
MASACHLKRLEDWGLGRISSQLPGMSYDCIVLLELAPLICSSIVRAHHTSITAETDFRSRCATVMVEGPG